VQAATASLDFLRQFAPLPVRITKIGRAKAIEADFQGVPFSTFISADNYYQGFLHTKNEALVKPRHASVPKGQVASPDNTAFAQRLLLVLVAEALLRPTVSAFPAADVQFF
jgi:hypothetical protein